MSRLDILLFHEEACVLASDERNGQAIVLLKPSLEGVEVKLARFLIISLPLLKIDPIYGSLDKSRCNILIQLLKKLTCSHDIRLDLFEHGLLEEYFDFIFYSHQPRIRKPLLKLCTHQTHILELLLDELGVALPQGIAILKLKE